MLVLKLWLDRFAFNIRFDFKNATTKKGTSFFNPFRRVISYTSHPTSLLNLARPPFGKHLIYKLLSFIEDTIGTCKSTRYLVMSTTKRIRVFNITVQTRNPVLIKVQMCVSLREKRKWSTWFIISNCQALPFLTKHCLLFLKKNDPDV